MNGPGLPGGAGRPAPGAAPLGATGALLLVGLAVLGVAVGLAGSFVQAMWLPGGLLLALAGAAGLFHGGRRLVGSRAGGAVPAIGWIAPVLYFANGRTEGDFVLANGIGPYAYLLVGAVVGVAAATVPVRAPR